MSQIAISGNASGTGVFTIASPNSNVNYTQTLPAATGTLYIPGTTVSNIQAGTAVASTSGTSIDFTSIPSWVRRVTVLGQGISTNGTSSIILRVGSGSIVSTGYQITQALFAAASISTINSTNTTSFDLSPGGVAAAGIYNFKASLDLLGSNTYVATIFGGRADGTAGFQEVGAITLSGALDRVRMTTVGGTDTFDAGSINILYE